MQWKPNVTVAAVIEKDNRFLLVQERIDGNLVYNQPAGHLEDKETLIEAVIREVREETAWIFLPQSITGIYLFKPEESELTYLRVCFSGTCVSHDDSAALDDGIEQVKWMSRDEIEHVSSQLRTRLVKQCITDYCDGHSWPLDVLKP